jgi:hypothetical protein
MRDEEIGKVSREESSPPFRHIELFRENIQFGYPLAPLPLAEGFLLFLLSRLD